MTSLHKEYCYAGECRPRVCICDKLTEVTERLTKAETMTGDSVKWFDECGIAYRRAHDAEAALDQWVRQAEDNSGGWQRCQLELEATKERLAGAMDVLQSIFDPKAPDDALSKAAQKFVDLNNGL